MFRNSIKTRRFSAQGIGRLGLLIIVLILLCGAYVGNQVLPFYYYYHEVLGLMENQAAKASLFTDDQIRKTLMKQIKKLEIPIEDEDDLKINRDNGTIIIDFSYEEVLFVDFGEERSYDLHVFKFNPHVEQAY